MFMQEGLWHFLNYTTRHCSIDNRAFNFKIKGLASPCTINTAKMCNKYDWIKQNKSFLNFDKIE